MSDVTDILENNVLLCRNCVRSLSGLGYREIDEKWTNCPKTNTEVVKKGNCHACGESWDHDKQWNPEYVGLLPIVHFSGWKKRIKGLLNYVAGLKSLGVPTNDGTMTLAPDKNSHLAVSPGQFWWYYSEQGKACKGLVRAVDLQDKIAIFDGGQTVVPYCRLIHVYRPWFLSFFQSL